ncbi:MULTISPECIES: hypothetical protein [Streptomyces]|uniref:Uncharacterized protein n=1 Tax=Streptomyces zinciresistens K42 TaxID=700597 RepID=G2GEX3_9ACTN|nr:MULTISPECIES: hypothetical protein [Streptomyces]EGX57914.1 hypothetical protein SZN_20282 [Streptomyces zinciresistens K42]MDT9700181.1 hypothetical protein [Streptomyces sp. P17]
MPTSTAQDSAPTLAAAITFVSLHASQNDLDRIYAAAKDRAKALRETRAASITTGALIRIDRIRPQYLVGLTGKVTATRTARTKTYVTVELDEASTEELRATRKHPIPDDVKRHKYDGIPASCCFEQ